MTASRAPDLTSQDRARAERLVARGEEYLATGNVIAARDFFKRAADAGLAAGALRLAATYDPAELRRLQAHGIVPGRTMARKRARELSASEAVERLVLLHSNTHASWSLPHTLVSECDHLYHNQQPVVAIMRKPASS